MIEKKKEYSIDLYIEQVSSLMPYQASTKAKILEGLREELDDAMKESKALDPSIMFGTPELTAKNLCLSQKWFSDIVGYKKRIIAYIIDLFFSLLVYFGLFYYSFRPSFISLINTWSSAEITSSAKFSVLLANILIELPLGIIGLIFYFGYFLIFEGLYSTTIGKRLLGLVVVDNSGIKITWKQSFLRNISKLNPLWVPLLILELIGGIYIRKTPHQRAFDIVAETKVVKRNSIY